MKAFVAAEGSAIVGELVVLGFACCFDRANPDDMPCGCGRVMLGVVSGQATENFTVAELGMDLAAYTAILRDHYPEDDDWTDDDVRDEAIDLAAMALAFQVGELLERRVDTIMRAGQ